jgi:hypothetical protein
VDYPRELAEKIAGAIVEADKAAAPAELRVGSARQENLAFNRRYFMQDGTVGWNPGKKNPKIVRPAGPIDPEISILAIELEPGHAGPDAILLSFALHADTVGGLEYSADYPHYLEDGLRSRLKAPGLFSVFGQGTSGDVNHVDVSTDRPQKGHEEAERIGAALAGHVYGALGSLAASVPRGREGDQDREDLRPIPGPADPRAGSGGSAERRYGHRHAARRDVRRAGAGD